jgi:methionyl-tRNA formyltransferase
LIVVAGKNNIAVHALDKLVDHFGPERIIAVPNINAPGLDSWQRSLRLAATRRGVVQMNINEIKSEEITIFLSLEYDQIINPKLFVNARLYNIHFSCLPKYKGMYTSIWPILYGDQSSGVTLHKIDNGIDTGDIFAHQKFLLSDKDRSRDLYRKYINSAIELFDEKFHDILNDKLISTSQPSKESTYFSKNSINFSNLKINLNCTAWELERQVYAYSFREYQLPEIYGRKIVEIDISSKKSDQKPGVILRDNGNSFMLSTIDYDVALYEDDLDFVLESLATCEWADVLGLLKHTSGVHDRNVKGWSPIIVAAYYGNYAAAKYLLDNGANPNDTNYKGTTVLMYAKDFALAQSDRRLFDLLRSVGASTAAKDHSGKSLIDYISPDEADFLGI